MRILFISRGLDKPSYGAETASKLLYDYLVNLHDVYALTDDKYFKGKGEVFFNPSILLKIPILEYILFRFFGRIKLKKMCRKIKPDLIIQPVYSGYAIPVSKKYKTIILFQDDPSFIIKDTLSPKVISSLFSLWYNIIRSMKKVVIRKKYHYLSISKNMTKSLLKLGIEEDKIFTLSYGYYGIYESSSDYMNEWKEFITKKAIEEDDFIILFVGSLYFTKGLHTIIQAIKESNDKKIKLIVAGNEMPFFGKFYVKKIKEEIHESKLVDQVVLLGHVNKDVLTMLYKNCSTVLSSSFSEGCQLSLLEAAYHNAPIIASKVGAAEDQFHGKADFFQPGDYNELSKIISSNKLNKTKKINYQLINFEEYSSLVTKWLKKFNNKTENT